jgi:hypothetical protein
VRIKDYSNVTDCFQRVIIIAKVVILNNITYCFI